MAGCWLRGTRAENIERRMEQVHAAFISRYDACDCDYESPPRLTRPVPRSPPTARSDSSAAELHDARCAKAQIEGDKVSGGQVVEPLPRIDGEQMFQASTMMRSSRAYQVKRATARIHHQIGSTRLNLGGVRRSCATALTGLPV